MIEYLTEFFVVASLIAIPVYISNGLALICGRGKPLDFGKTFYDGRPLLGKGKTFIGTAAGIFFGTVGAAIVAAFFPQVVAFLPVSYLNYGLLLAAGAMVGDIVASFAKRRGGLQQGNSVFLLDQLDFLFGGIAVGGFLFIPRPEVVLFLAVFTFSIHKFANFLAFKAKIKKVPW